MTDRKSETLCWHVLLTVSACDAAACLIEWSQTGSSHRRVVVIKLFWQYIRNVIPRMTIQTLLQSLLIQIMTCHKPPTKSQLQTRRIHIRAHTFRKPNTVIPDRLVNHSPRRSPESVKSKVCLHGAVFWGRECSKLITSFRDGIKLFHKHL